MAEASAAAAAAVSQHRFFCHSCKGEVSPKLPVSAGGWGGSGAGGRWVRRGRGRGLSAPLPPPGGGGPGWAGPAPGVRGSSLLPPPRVSPLGEGGAVWGSAWRGEALARPQTFSQG